MNYEIKLAFSFDALFSHKDYWWHGLGKKPNEDCFNFSEKFPIFSVADGITRILKKNSYYPTPSGPKLAAEAVCKETVNYLEKKYPDINKKELIQAFNQANREINQINKSLPKEKDKELVPEDPYASLGVTGVIVGDSFHYIYLSDCGLIIYDENKKIKFQTPDILEGQWGLIPKEVKSFENKAEQVHFDRLIRRNNPSPKSFPEQATYGALTGEQEVKEFYQMGKVNLVENDIVVLYSDGFEPFLGLSDFVQLICSDKKNEALKSALEKLIDKKSGENKKLYGQEKTLIAAQVN